MIKIASLTLLGLLAAPVVMAENFTLQSPQMQPGGVVAGEQVFNGFGCQGSNVSPALNSYNFV